MARQPPKGPKGPDKPPRRRRGLLKRLPDDVPAPGSFGAGGYGTGPFGGSPAAEQPNNGEPQPIETEAEAASTEPQIVELGIATEQDEALQIDAALVRQATMRTGLIANSELDRIEISHGDVVRADAVREHVQTSLAKLEELKQELAALRGCDEGGRRGDNEQVAPMTKESLNDLRTLVDNIIALHGLSSFSRGHAQIIRSHSDYLHSVKEVFSSLPKTVKAGAHFVIVFEAACRALKGLYEILASLLE